MAYETDQIAHDLEILLKENPDLDCKVAVTLDGIVKKLTDGRMIFFCWHEEDVRIAARELELREPTTEECIDILATAESGVDWGRGFSSEDIEYITSNRLREDEDANDSE